MYGKKPIIKKSDKSLNADELKKNIQEKVKNKDKTLSKLKETSILKADISINSKKENYPKNINEYRHIIETLKVNDKDLEWLLDLRKYTKIIQAPEKTTASLLPNLTKYEIPKKKEYWDSSYKGDSNCIEHLIRKRIGSNANISTLEFETTLRNFSSYNKSNKNKKWKNIFSKDFSDMSSFLAPSTKGNIRALSKIDKYITRPPEIKINTMEYLNRKTMIRKYSQKNMTCGFLGEHFGLPQYDENFSNPNINLTRHILNSTCNNNVAKWTCGLRNIINLKNKKLENSERKVEKK